MGCTPYSVVDAAAHSGAQLAAAVKKAGTRSSAPPPPLRKWLRGSEGAGLMFSKL
jgi:hypothetical protein